MINADYVTESFMQSAGEARRHFDAIAKYD
jgi:hypothetical protein